MRDYVHHHGKAIGGSTARRYGQFGERLIARLGRLDLRDLREEDIAAFVTAEFEDGRAKDPTINACVLLRSVLQGSGRLSLKELGLLEHSGAPKECRRPAGIEATRRRRLDRERRFGDRAFERRDVEHVPDLDRSFELVEPPVRMELYLLRRRPAAANLSTEERDHSASPQAAGSAHALDLAALGQQKHPAVAKVNALADLVDEIAVRR